MTQKEEIELAAKEKRQPICVHCEKPIDEISQEEIYIITWKWDTEEKRYYNTGRDPLDSPAPMHDECGFEDWNYFDTENKAYIQLGLNWS